MSDHPATDGTTEQNAAVGAWRTDGIVVRGMHFTPADIEAMAETVRIAWVEWAKVQPNPKPRWLVPWESLPEPDRDADRFIGVFLLSRMAEWFGDEALRVLSPERDTALSAQQSAERELVKAMRVVDAARRVTGAARRLTAAMSRARRWVDEGDEVEDALRALDAATEGGEGYSAAALAECDCEKWRDLNAENASLRDDIEELRPQLATAKSLVDGLEKLEEELAAAEQHKADLRLHVDLAVKKCEMAEADRERLRECQVETQAKLELTERTNASLRQQCRDADERFLALLEERNAAQKKLAATEGGKTCQRCGGSGTVATTECPGGVHVMPAPPQTDYAAEDAAMRECSHAAGTITLCVDCGDSVTPSQAEGNIEPSNAVAELVEPVRGYVGRQPFGQPQTEGGESAEADEKLVAAAVHRAIGNLPVTKMVPEPVVDALRAQLAEAEKREAELKAQLSHISEAQVATIGAYRRDEPIIDTAIALVASWQVESYLPPRTRACEDALIEAVQNRGAVTRLANAAEQARAIRPLVTDAPSKPKSVRMLGSLGMKAKPSGRDAIAREIASWDAPSKPWDESMRRNAVPCTCDPVAISAPDKTRGDYDKICPVHGVNRSDQDEAINACKHGSPSCTDCLRLRRPVHEANPPTCKHGAPNCTAEHEE